MLKDLFYSESIQKIFNLLKGIGSESRFIGGCVRDAILGIEKKDVDIATTCLPHEVEALLNKNNIKTINVGKSFGTIIAITEEGYYEITTLRKDIEFYDGRHAVVEYSKDWIEDAKRRDFTFNAMSYCPYQNQLFDYFSGKDDLAQGVVRFIGNASDRVKEDYLRILRFFRFYAYYGQSIDRESLEACVEDAKKLKVISSERKWGELEKILLSNRCIEVLDLMIKNQVLDHVLEYKIDYLIIDDLASVHNQILKNSHDSSSLLILFSIVYLANIKVKDLQKILSLSNKETQHISKLYDCVNTLRATDVILNLYSYIYKWHYLLLDSITFLVALDKREDLENLYQETKNILDNHHMHFPVNGYDIMQCFSVKPNEKLIGSLLNKGRDFWCKEKFKPTKEQIIKYISDNEKYRN
jgi:poly(A) polymerase